MDEQLKQFIHKHLTDDIRKLALTAQPVGVDLRFALQQIDGRQRAKAKLPALTANADIIFPVHLSVEQCSSEYTAEYKTRILRNALSQSNPLTDATLIDLTGGFGIDFIALSKLFAKAIYVERNAELCAIAAQNFQTLCLKNTEIHNQEAEDFLQSLPKATKNIVFFADPARRSASGSRTYAISDCTPDIVKLLPNLQQTGEMLLLKLSPMLDWHKAFNDIQDCGANVSEVHIVSVKNECKELLLLIELQNAPQEGIKLFCVNDESITEVTTKPSPHPSPQGEGVLKIDSSDSNSTSKANLRKPPLEGKVWRGAAAYLLVPNASIMKAGCWQYITDHFNVVHADANSHLFLSEQEQKGFPGKQYCIKSICSLNKKELRIALQGISQANISVRNFPLSADELRKRLKLKDGGRTYIFGTTIHGEHKLIITNVVDY